MEKIKEIIKKLKEIKKKEKLKIDDNVLYKRD